MAEIYTTSFTDATPTYLPGHKYGSDWPVVYILDNDKEAYVGETLDASVRMYQHLQNPERRRLTEINLISDSDFNKSVVLDLEAFLIKRMSVDGRFDLQNGNMGLHVHNYFNRAHYESQFKLIWQELVKRNLAKNSLKEIENSDLFKYSPYNSLSTDQYATVASMLRLLAEKIEKNQILTCIVHGGPGTGKTVLAVHLMKLLTERYFASQLPDPEEDEYVASIADSLRKLPRNMRIGFVVPMQSLRTTIKKVFDKTAGLNSGMVISPMEVAKGPHYDLLIVDEAHRLRQRKALSQYPAYDQNNKLLGLPKDGTELDWIKMKSSYQILFYDPYQSVKPADIDPQRFKELMLHESTQQFRLVTQFRCKGGDRYIQYARAILNEEAPEKMESFEGYDLQLFEDCGKMTDKIHELNQEYDLCRTVAGYAWKWASKEDKSLYDIVLDGRQYRWNSVDRDWINHPNSINEIGCIHTIQGYDLNYCAVIFGYEIDYDPEKGKFIISKNKYQDTLAKSVGDNEKLLEDYILNIYKTLLTRGIRGTYVYACNPGMREYLKRYIPVAEQTKMNDKGRILELNDMWGKGLKVAEKSVTWDEKE